MRLIGGNVCVSCYNRQREWVLGRNGKGKKPVTHPDLARRRLSVLVAGTVRLVDRPLTVSSLELVVEVLRDSQKSVVFGLGVNHGQ